MKPLPPPKKFIQLVSKNFRKDKFIFLFDFDGTLVAFQENPEAVEVPPETLRALQKLSQMPHFSVMILSGRPLAFLRKTFGAEILLTGEHGARSNFVELLESGYSLKPLPNKVTELLDSLLLKYPQSFIETKSKGWVWHYRKISHLISSRQILEISHTLNELLKNHTHMCQTLNSVLEIKPKFLDKSHYWKYLSKNCFPEYRCICLGDDHSEEEIFRNLGRQDISIAVGDVISHADFRVETPEILGNWIQEFVQVVPSFSDF